MVLWVAAITVFGIFAVGSAGGADYQQKQLLGFIFGLFSMLLLSFFEYGVFLKFYIPIYAVNVLLLLLVRFIGDEAGGAVRWVEIANIRFQPSEFTKIFMILFFAKFFEKNKARISDFRVVLASLACFAMSFYLIIDQPDLSTSIIVAGIFFSMLFAAGLSWKYMAAAAAVAIPAIVVFLSIVLQPDQTLLEDYQRNRILAWLRPESYTQTEAFQQLNSITAIGSGQLFGKGYNNNEVASVTRGNFISQPQTDFIFAVIGEEFGFAGCMAIVGLLLLISLECFIAGFKAKDVSGMLICVGMGVWVCFQGMVNIGVTTGLLPNTGLTLPFVSAGLTSLIALYVGIGFVLSVRMQAGRIGRR